MTLVERAIAREVGETDTPSRPRPVEHPLVRSRRTGVDLTSDEVVQLLADDEAERFRP